jgi:hypothetical protein
MARYGMKSFANLTLQNTSGVVEVASGYSFPIKSESLNKSIDRLEQRALRGMARHKPLKGPQSVTGEIEIDAYPSAVAVCLRSVLDCTLTWSGGLHQHRFTVGSHDFDDYLAVQPLTVEINKDGDADSKYFQDMCGDGLAISLTTGEPVALGLSVIGVGHRTAAKGTMFFRDEKPFLWSQSSVSFDGIANMDFESIEISIQNALEARWTLQNTAAPKKIKRSDMVSVEVTAEICYDPGSFEAAFNDYSDHRLALSVQNADGVTMAVDLPELTVTEYAETIEGPGVMIAKIKAMASYSQASGDMAVFTAVNSLPGFFGNFVLTDSYYGLLDQSYNFLRRI